MTQDTSLYDKDKGKLDYLYEDDTAPDKCPKCGSDKVCSCPGGIAMKMNLAIKWICQDCQYEW